MTMKNGDEYSGQFHDDLFEGYSLYKFANGDVYTGDFHKGIMGPRKVGPKSHE